MTGMESDIYKILDCLWCDKSFQQITIWQLYCCKKCSNAGQNNKKKIARGITNNGFCLRCNSSLSGKRANAIYCSKTCKSMDHTFKHRSKTRVQSIARRYKIFERDSFTCYMCLKKLNKSDFELDHLIPISRGGDNSANNLAVSCRSCNRSRGSRIDILQLSKLFELRNNDDY